MRDTTALSKRDDDVTSIKSELLVMKWMVAVALAFQIAIAVLVFSR